MKKFNFMDYLFETVDDNNDDENETVIEQPVKQTSKSVVKPVIKPEPVKPDNTKITKTVKAEDVLYKKGQSAFIDYGTPSETHNTSNKVEEKKEEETYEFSANISPIFGVIESKEKEPAPVKVKVVSSQVNKPDNSHLDIVPSPIYGYSSKEEAERENYVVNNLDDEEDELHRLFETQDNLHVKDEEINLFDAYEED